MHCRGVSRQPNPRSCLGGGPRHKCCNLSLVVKLPWAVQTYRRAAWLVSWRLFQNDMRAMDNSRPFTIALVELGDVFSTTSEMFFKNPTIGAAYAGRRRNIACRVQIRKRNGADLIRCTRSNHGADPSVPLIGLKSLHEMQLNPGASDSSVAPHNLFWPLHYTTSL